MDRTVNSSTAPDKELKESLQTSIDIAKQVFKSNKTRLNFSNYLMTVQMAQCVCSLTNILNEQKEMLEQACKTIDDYSFLLRYIKRYIGRADYYNSMIYAAYTALEERKKERAGDDSDDMSTALE